MFVLVKILVRGLALLPLPLLYVLSDLLRFVLFFLVRYRREVVMDNLAHAFPEKSESDRRSIRLRFQKHFCDQIVESIKLFNTSKRSIGKRFVVDREVYDQLYAEGRNALQATGHFFNWEWGNWALNLNCDHQVRIIFMIMRNKEAEPFINGMRLKGGAELISAKDLKGLLSDSAKPSMTVFLADQNPAIKERAIWVEFFGRRIPFQKGLELIARRKNDPVVFDRIERVRRGQYRSHSRLAFLEPNKTQEGEITEAFVAFMEESIRAQPENWVWTHKRWKYAEGSAF